VAATQDDAAHGACRVRGAGHGRTHRRMVLVVCESVGTASARRVARRPASRGAAMAKHPGQRVLRPRLQRAPRCLVRS
jgi:hypothetical protein